jgi:rfaE bifunctional protein nucleotidyltransferase chain/domain
MDKWDSVKHKIVDIATAATIVDSWVNNDKRVVFTNGCFDILHRGHISYLAQAANAGSYLIVGVNSDQSVKQLNKGANRPVNDENSRALLIAALAFVDLVVIFDDETPLELIKRLRPNVLIKGADYNPHQTDTTANDYIVGAKEVRDNGGEVNVIELEQGYSTTHIIERILNSSNS